MVKTHLSQFVQTNIPQVKVFLPLLWNEDLRYAELSKMRLIVKVNIIPNAEISTDVTKRFWAFVENIKLYFRACEFQHKKEYYAAFFSPKTVPNGTKFYICFTPYYTALDTGVEG